MPSEVFFRSDPVIDKAWASRVFGPRLRGLAHFAPARVVPVVARAGVSVVASPAAVRADCLVAVMFDGPSAVAVATDWRTRARHWLFRSPGSLCNEPAFRRSNSFSTHRICGKRLRPGPKISPQEISVFRGYISGPAKRARLARDL